MTSFQQFGFGRNDESVGKRVKRFKAQGGQRYRISMAWWEGLSEGKLNLDADTCEFVGAKRNYIPGVGYVINRGPEFTRLANDEPPRMAIATIIIVWPMNSKGKIDRRAIAAGDFEVCPWVFGQDKYNALAPIHGEFPFGSHDITISCADTQYQKMTFSPCKDSILAMLVKQGGELVQSIIEQAATIAANIQGEIGRELSLDQIRDKLAGGTGAGDSSGPATVVATEEIDDLVDGLLDE